MRALNPKDHNAERIDKELRKQADELNWDGIEFPMTKSHFQIFERNN